MTHASLFSGIGGFDLAAEWIGWQNLFHCEWNPFGQQVLKHHFPNSKSYNDITKTDFTIHRGQVDILTGGFPCQPYSSAGKRLGKEDDRHLWPHMLRTIQEVQPSWVVGENVRGLTNWNGGMVFDEVQADLETEGYEVTPFLLPACAVNAPHRRDRIWFVAYASNTNSNGFNECNGNNEINTSEGREYAFSNIEQICKSDIANSKNSSSKRELLKQQKQREFRGCDSTITSNTESKRLQRTFNNRESSGRIQSKFTKCNSTNEFNQWQNFPTQSPICGGDDGLPKELDNITFSKWRQESIKAYGNAIVPQVAFQIFKAIQQYEAL